MGHRARIDQAIRDLWIAFFDATAPVPVGAKPFEPTDGDLDAWSAVTRHPAIQDRFRSAFGSGFTLERGEAQP